MAQFRFELGTLGMRLVEAKIPKNGALQQRFMHGMGRIGKKEVSIILSFFHSFPIATEESSSAAQSRTPILKHKRPTTVPKESQNKECQEAKKAFEARLWETVKCTQS